MNTCKACKHWKQDPNSIIPRGNCGYVKRLWENSRWSETATFEPVRQINDDTHKAFVQDGEDFAAYLITLPDFGCTEHAV